VKKVAIIERFKLSKNKIYVIIIYVFLTKEPGFIGPFVRKFPFCGLFATSFCSLRSLWWEAQAFSSLTASFPVYFS